MSAGVRDIIPCLRPTNLISPAVQSSGGVGLEFSILSRELCGSWDLASKGDENYFNLSFFCDMPGALQ